MSHSDRFTDTGATSAFYQGAEAERDRIVKLLTDKQYFGGFLLDWAYSNPSAEDALAVVETVIALIKGEQPHPPQHFRDRSNGE
jgi:hypothetical protein